MVNFSLSLSLFNPPCFTRRVLGVKGVGAVLGFPIHFILRDSYFLSPLLVVLLSRYYCFFPLLVVVACRVASSE